ncbi:MAG TPA: hypothetical protein VFS45_02915, partial [Sphingomicrobium sp.]|nr:hypothetical protein [Sphingomicrobium sp.]
VLVLTPYGNVAWPAVELRRLQWTSRFMFLWMVPAILREPDRHEALARFVREAVADDLARNRPRLILIDRRLVAFLAADRRVRAGLQDYEPGPRFGSLLSWRRKQARSARPAERAVLRGLVPT